jgi:AGCS family alanine or glycine:cation symporter
VFVDTTLLCTLTALALLTALPALPAGVGGISLVRLAFSTVFGRAAGSLLSLLLFFFAYATILCQAFYGRVCTESVTRARGARALYDLAFCSALLMGAIGTPALVWQACDILLGVMTLCNLFLLLRERKTILLLTKEEGLL